MLILRMKAVFGSAHNFLRIFGYLLVFFGIFMLVAGNDLTHKGGIRWKLEKSL